MATNATIKREYKNPDYYKTLGGGTVQSVPAGGGGSGSGTEPVDLSNYLTIAQIDASYFNVQGDTILNGDLKLSNDQETEQAIKFYDYGNEGSQYAGIKYDSGDNYLYLYNESGENLRLSSTGKVKLYYDNEVRLQTISGGMELDGSVWVHDKLLPEGGILLADNQDTFFGDLIVGMKVYNDGTYLRFDKGSAASAPSFYITSDVPTTYIYSTNIYLGNTAGDYIRFRGNSLSGNEWSIGTDGKLTTDGIESNSVSFIDGFLGAGYKINIDSENKSNAQFDDLFIRNSLRAHTYEISKVRYTAGTRVASAGNAIGDSSLYVDSSGVYFEVESTNSSLQEDDIIVSQANSGLDIYSEEYYVSYVSGANDKVYIRETTDYVPKYSSYDWIDWNDIDMYDFYEYSGGVDIETGASSGSMKSDTFDLTGRYGSIKLTGSWNEFTGYPELTFGLYNSSNTLISNEITVDGTTESINDYLRITGTVSTTCYIKCTMDPQGYYEAIIEDMKIYATPYTATLDFNTLDKEFVQMGNLTDTTRQNIIVESTTDSNSPYTAYYQGVNDTTLTSAMQKVRVGNLNGQTSPATGDTLGGMGLMGENVHLSGAITTQEGYLASFNIAGDQLWTEDAGLGWFGIDSTELSIKIKDTGDITKIVIAPTSIPSLSSIASASNKSYTGNYASAYTDVTHSFSYTGVTSSNWYVQEYTGSSSYLDLLTSSPSTTYQIPVTANMTYNAVLKWNTVVDYTLPTNDNNPDPDGVTSTYTLGGSFTQTITVTAYDSAATVLATQTTNLTNKTSDQTNITIFNKAIKPTTSYVYLKVYVFTGNNLVTDYSHWLWQESYPGSGDWARIGDPIVGSQNLAVDFDMEVEELTLTGTYNQVQIGDNGISHYTSSSKYFMLNEDETDYIQSNGDATIKGDWTWSGAEVYVGEPNAVSTSVDSRLHICYRPSGSVSTTEDFGLYGLNVNTNYSTGYVAGFFNDGGNYNRYGLRIRCGSNDHRGSTSDNLFIVMEEGDGAQMAAIVSDSTSTRLYSVPSDASTKADINDLDVNAIEKLQQVRPKSFRYKDKDKDGKRTVYNPEKPKVEGYIAQEALDAIPGMGKIINGDYSICETAVIPYLHKAILELKEQNDTQEQFINDLQYELEQTRTMVEQLRNEMNVVNTYLKIKIE